MRHRALPGALLAVLLLGLAAALAACASAPPPDASDRGRLFLPEGDPYAGRTAFLDLQCCVCHAVKGGGFPEPSIYPPLPFVLGEEWREPPDRMWLATSIINPAHEMPRGHLVSVPGGGEVYRMKEYGDSMTVGQMVDLVAFLEDLGRQRP